MKEYFTCRKILHFVIIIGFLLDASFFTNLPTAIVTMIKTNTSYANQTNFLHVPQYEWTVVEKNHFLGALYLGFLCAEAVGGRLSDLYGPKKIYGISTFIASILTLFQPLACEISFKMAFATRLLLGVFISPSLPASTTLIVNWFAPSERTKSAAAISTFNFGIGITMQLYGLLIYYFGWPTIFYVNGACGLIWTIIWFYFIYDTPEQHPRITFSEKQSIKMKMIKETNGTNGGVRKIEKKLPFTQIISCIPFLVIVLCRLCYGCCHAFIKFQLPTYLNDILKFNIKQNGFYSSLPFIGYVFCAICACHIADKLLKSNRFSKTTVRKLMECFYLLIVSISMVLLAWFGLNATLAIFLFIVSVMSMGTKTAGHYGNIIDMAPNFSGTLVGITLTFNSMGAWFSTFICGILLKDKNNFESWQNIFYFMAGFSFICAILYAVFANAELQRWNDIEGNSIEENNMQLSLKNEANLN